jgi:CDP-paratose 2-epimerase
MRSRFFGPAASTSWSRQQLEISLPNYEHHAVDIRDEAALQRIFERYARDVAIVIHAAAQPSHDWAAREPLTDFTVNALGTMQMLEAVRKHSPNASFIFLSTNKVYGDVPNRLPLVELATRYEVDERHPYFAHGIDEQMSIDQSKHSLFGVSKLSADAMVQEYGRYFGMNTVCFRGGCLTGPGHSGAQLHGFLAYLAQCAVADRPYTVIGHRGKQVRDNIHAVDLVRMFWHYHQQPRPGEVYNAGGGRFSNCSVLEAIAICEQLTEKPMRIAFDDQPRAGDHIWYISDTRKFREHYPQWNYTMELKETIAEIVSAAAERVSAA